MLLIKKYLIFLISAVFIIPGCERNAPTETTGSSLPPAVPTNVKIYSAYDGEIEIVWHANVELDLKGYNVYRSTDSTRFSLIDFSDQNYYLDDSLDYNIKYFYRITALDLENRESNYSSIVSAVPKNIYKPYAPRFPQINARNWIGEKSVFLTWDPGFETDIAGFYVYRSTMPGFTPDSTNLNGFAPGSSYSDTSGLSLLTPYFYKIVAVDKGNLLSDPSSEVSDKILPIAGIVSPIGTVKTNVLTFKFTTLPVTATYEITLQSNPYFGQIWSKVITTSAINDTISVDYDGNYIDYGENYYWRVVTYTNDNSSPNSISPLFNFILQPE